MTLLFLSRIRRERDQEQKGAGIMRENGDRNEEKAASGVRNTGKVYITGDKHGAFRTFFDLAEKKLMDEKDILLIAGDASYVWDEDYLTKIHTLEQLFPGTLCFIDGNHENHRILNSLPVTKWHGGRVHRIGERVFHLLRGEIYEINGRHFFTFGGARSVSGYVEGTEGIDWWSGEEPSKAEIAYGRQQLWNNIDKIDYVLTHEAPLSARGRISRVKRIDADYVLPSVLEEWYEEVLRFGRMRKWYFGHMHTDQECSPTLRAVFNNVLEIETEKQVRWA